MPYSYPRNVPRVSKNWDAGQQKKCTAAANAVLRGGGSEREAIYACIHAAGKGKKKMEKAGVTKSEGDGKHPSSHYLVVEDPSKPTTWHLRVRDTSGKPNHTLMGAAWAALHGGYRGNKYQGPQKSAALAKLRKLYASEGLTPPSEKTLTTFFKDKQDGLWFIGVYSNNYIDRQQEIITEKAHQEYAQWLKTTGVQPPIVMLHLPRFPEIVHYVMLLALATGKMTVDKYNALMMELYKSTAIAQTKSVIVKNGFSFVIGKVIESKRPLVEKLMKMQKTWGMSHGFIPLKFDDTLDTITMYRAFEFTLAPESLSANGLTAIGFKEDKMADVLLKDKELSEEERAAIQQVFDEEDAETATAKAREVLRDLLASKMEVATEETEDENPTPSEEDTDTDDYKALVGKLAEDFKLEELATIIKTIGERLTALEATQDEVAEKIQEIDQTEDDRVVNQYFKNFKGVDWTLGFGAHKLDQKEADEDQKEEIEKLKGDIPKQFVEGQETDPKNALQVGFWGPLLGNS